MEYRELVEGVRIPVLGLGTWGMGGRDYSDRGRDEEEVAAMRMAIELGMTHIDTAEYYGAGHAEELVGEAIRGFRRQGLFITTKVWRTNLQYDDLLASMRGSLERLGVDHVDLYLVHWPNPRVPLAETMRAMERCADEGHTRFIGVSNFSAQLMEEAQSHLRNQKLVANQVEYSLLDQKPAVELLPYCREKGAMLVSYRPLARGGLTRPGHPVLDEIAELYGKSRAQVAINWLIGQEGVVAIPKSSNPIHLLDNMGALGWRMDPEDARRLARSFL